MIKTSQLVEMSMVVATRIARAFLSEATDLTLFHLPVTAIMKRRVMKDHAMRWDRTSRGGTWATHLKKRGKKPHMEYAARP
jgi:hypothetical protein